MCAGCMATECGTCRYCMDMKKRGGSGTLRRPCERRGCVATSSGEHSASATSGRPSKKPRVRDGSRLSRREANKKARPLLEKLSQFPLETRGVRVDGRIYGAAELCALSEAVALEDPRRAIDWAKVAGRLRARDVTMDALITLKRAASRLEHESNPNNANEKDVYSPFYHQRSEDEDDDRATRWSPDRCLVLWRYVAYALVPPEQTTNANPVDDQSLDDVDEYVMDPYSYGYKAHGEQSKKKALAEIEKKKGPSRIGELEAAAMLCATAKQTERRPSELPPTSADAAVAFRPPAAPENAFFAKEDQFRTVGNLTPHAILS